MQSDTNISDKQAKRINEKSSWFIGSTHSPVDITNIQKHLIEFPFWAYIMHDNDDGKSLHIHFIANIFGSRSIKSICDTLECDYQDVQVCRNPVGSTRYLIHLDDKDKFQYDVKDIVSNDRDRVEWMLTSMHSPITSLFDDFRSVKLGQLSSRDFLERYKGEFSRMSFYQKIKVLEVIDKMDYK